MQAGQLRNGAGLSGRDLLIPMAGAGDGFEDGLTAGVGRDTCVADDEAQGTTLLNVAESAVKRSDRREARCRRVRPRISLISRGHAQTDLYV